MKNRVSPPRRPPVGLTLALAACIAAPAAADPLRDALLGLHEFDRPYRVDVQLRERASPADGRLFADLPAPLDLHPSYQATHDLCARMDPYNRSDAEVSDAEIMAYLETVRDTAPILEAFFVTGRGRLEDLKDAWFRTGRGFEHVFCGETSSRRGKLGGYHFWYQQYRHERDGTARYEGTAYRDPAGIEDPHIVTGRFTWDPDGPGGEPPLRKSPKGGFTVGHSPSVMLALGHILVYGAADAAPAGVDAVAHANINGRVYPWTFYKQDHGGGSAIRTLWPRWVPPSWWWDYPFYEPMVRVAPEGWSEGWPEEE